jgi:hypothetical protein
MKHNELNNKRLALGVSMSRLTSMMNKHGFNTKSERTVTENIMWNRFKDSDETFASQVKFCLQIHLSELEQILNA